MWFEYFGSTLIGQWNCSTAYHIQFKIGLKQILQNSGTHEGWYQLSHSRVNSHLYIHFFHLPLDYLSQQQVTSPTLDVFKRTLWLWTACLYHWLHAHTFNVVPHTLLRFCTVIIIPRFSEHHSQKIFRDPKQKQYLQLLLIKWSCLPSGAACSTSGSHHWQIPSERMRVWAPKVSTWPSLHLEWHIYPHW